MEPNLTNPFKATVATITVISGLVIASATFAAPVKSAPVDTSANLIVEF